MITNEPFTPEELKMIEARWKSDVDFKLDAMLEFMEEFKPLMKMLAEREARKVRVQQAIIDKSLAGLVYAALAALLALTWAGMKVGAREFIDMTKDFRK